jgi:phospholipase/carboxylesterase
MKGTMEKRYEPAAGAGADPHRNSPVVERGAPASRAKAAMILLHGRGSTAEGISDLAEQFAQPDVRYLAPQAAGRTWYPYPFTESIDRNEPHLGSALRRIRELFSQLAKEGFSQERVVLLGFSQGACLALHYAAVNPGKFGGVVSLSGALIGSALNEADYAGNLQHTPVFLGVGENENHFSMDRFEQSAQIMRGLNGSVVDRVYPDTGHSITHDEVKYIRGLLSSMMHGEESTDK